MDKQSSEMKDEIKHLMLKLSKLSIEEEDKIMVILTDLYKLRMSSASHLKFSKTVVEVLEGIGESAPAEMIKNLIFYNEEFIAKFNKVKEQLNKEA